MESTSTSECTPPSENENTSTASEKERSAKYSRDYRARQKTKGITAGKKKYGSRFEGFHGFDGEGMDYNGSHALYTLRAGDLELYNDGKALTSQQMITWIGNLPHKTYVGFSLGYDFTMILREFAPITYKSGNSFIKRLIGDRADWTDQEKQFGIRIPGMPGICIKYVPRKSLVITNYYPVSGKKINVVRISDTFGFFQSSFLNTLKDWKIGTDEEITIIKEGKSGRGNFTGSIEERQYNALECVLLEQLMNKFKTACDNANMTPALWEGAGWLATRMYDLHNNPKRKDTVLPDDIAPLADQAYYGGRFEVLRLGRIPRRIYDYDINSAYPSNMAELPCLLPNHGKWTKSRRRSPWKLHSVSWTPKNEYEPRLGPLPVRLKSGTVVFPLSSAPGAKDWYWSYEIDAAYPFDFTIHESRYYVQTCDCKPFGWVPDQYKERLRIQAEHGKQAAVAPKLGLNSLYGKTAQRVGDERPYFNLVYAGIITAMCRAQILKVAYDIPSSEHVLMIATDGIFTSLDIPDIDKKLTGTKELGGWDRTIFEDGLVIIQPGLYWEPVTHPNGLTKSRGISARVIAAHRVEAEKVWDTHRETKNIDFNVYIPSVFNSLEVSLARNKPERIGQWDTNVKRTYHYSVGEKRNVTRYAADGSWICDALKTAGPTVRSKDSNYEEYDEAKLDALNIQDSELLSEDPA